MARQTKPLTATEIKNGFNEKYGGLNHNYLL